MSASGASFEDANFQAALRSYLNLKKNVDPKKELRRRAKNVGLRLIKIHKEKGVKLQDITSKVNSLRVSRKLKIRPKIRSKAKSNPKKWGYNEMANAELRARKSAKGFTATGWFPAVEKLGGNPRDKANRTGPRRGSLVERLGFSEQSETLINRQPGAAYVATKTENETQQALNQETADMVKYIIRKQNEAARRAGL